MRFACLLLWLCVYALLPAQGTPIARFEGEIELPIDIIDVGQGLSQGFVPSIKQDREGYLWMATKEGLNRYDGYGFKVFRHDDADSHTVASNVINFAHVDAQNRVWACTNGGVLDRMDRQTETFVHHLPRIGEAIGGSNVFIWPMAEMPDGALLFPGLGGAVWNLVINEKEPGSNRNRVIDAVSRYPALLHILRDGKSNQALKSMPDGSIWAYAQDSISWFSTEALRSNLPPIAFPASPPLNWRIGKKFLSALLTDPSGNLYSIRGDSLLRFIPQSGKLVTVVRLPKGYAFTGSAMIDSQNRLWTATDNGKYLRLDLKRMAFVVIRPKGEQMIGKDSENTYFACEDRQHNIWLGTNGYGILKISAQAERFRSIPIAADAPYLHDQLWRDRIVRQGNRAAFDLSIAAQWDALNPRALLRSKGYEPQGLPTQLAVDAQGNFWIGGNRLLADGTMGCPVILRIAPEGGKVEEMAALTHKRSDWSPVPIIIDRDGDIWFGNSDGEEIPHFYHLDPATRKLEAHPFPVPAKPTGYPTISDWYETKDGIFWLGTTVGLLSFSKGDHRWQHWENNPHDRQSLSENIVFSVHPDPRAPQRYIWAGTNGGGLNCLDVITGKFRRYSTETGLPNNVIYAIQFGPRHNLWMSTNQGICLFNPITQEIRSFSQADGLPGNEFNRYEYSASPSGILYFGGVNGTAYFDPEDFYPDEPPATTVINRLKLANKPIVYSAQQDSTTSGFRLAQPIEQTQALVFPHDVQMITLGFSLLDFTMPSKNHFRYKLEHFNDEWIDAGSDHEATYTNLSPGDYTFEVFGCNSNGIWSLAPAKVNITILPPWWGTWWFRLAMVLLVSGLLYALYNYRLQQLLKVERLRNRIGQDLHDEIGSTLSSISLYSAVMQKTSDSLPPHTVGILDKIISSTSQMMESMNDMVWTIKASNDSFDNVVNRMRAFAVNMTEAQEIEMTFMVDPQVEKLSLGMEQRKNVYLIYKEAVNNAAKYARCSELTIELKKVQGFLELTITDNGIGFDPDDKAAREHLLGGNGLAGMQARAKVIHAKLTIDSGKGRGTTITLLVGL